MTNYGKMKYIERELRRFMPRLVDIDLVVKTTKVHWYMTIVLTFPNKRILMCSVKYWDMLDVYQIWNKLREALPVWVW